MIDRPDQIHAAELLLQELKAPQWAVSVMAWNEAGHQYLVVSVDPAYPKHLNIPSRFQGFDVKQEQRARFTAH